MRKLYYFGSALAVLAGFILLVSAKKPAGNPYGLKKGTPSVQSISALAFGPDGILFIGDSKSATVFAIDTKDNVHVDKAIALEVKNVDQKIAAALGTDVKNIRIQDIAVNPVSKKAYCAVQTGDGTPVLLTLEGDKVNAVSLKDILFSNISIANVPGEDVKDRGGRPVREQSISDMSFADGSVLLSGLSTQEFGSTFRKIPFPFTDKQEQASLEIYHASHGRFETNSPIRTFTTAELNGKKYLVASYTCTPLVIFPLDELKPGQLVKGRTVGEFGAGNSPIDMVTLKKDGASFLFMANSNRPIMRISYKNIESYEGALTEPIKESYATGGVSFVNLPTVNVIQMDKLDDNQVLVLQRRANGDLDLWTAKGDRWM
ncbi:MAG TPA: hypothetical protein VLJ68_03065 [Chitinophagaceae bacterium]|nr:hypothetical protein [Chitinophagaceae bacterium]